MLTILFNGPQVYIRQVVYNVSLAFGLLGDVHPIYTVLLLVCYDVYKHMQPQTTLFANKAECYYSSWLLKMDP